MMKIKKIQATRSFSTRLSLYIVFLVSSLFIAALCVVFFFSRQIIKNEAINNVEKSLSKSIQQIENVLQTVEMAMDNIDWYVIQNINNPDSMPLITRRFVGQNKNIIGSAVAFEPYYYPSKGYFYAPYTYKIDSLITMQLGSIDYEYHYMDWYQISKLLKKDYWSEPYYDVGGGEMVMSTYARPLYDQNNELFAVMTADISLEWLTNFVNDKRPFPNSYYLMIGKGGTYIVHRYPDRVLTHTIFTPMSEEDVDTAVINLGHKMIAGERGMSKFWNEGELFYVYYAPIHDADWSLAVVCPHDDIYDSLDRMQLIIAFVVILGLFLILFLSIRIIRMVTKPLRRFADSAVSIAGGDFETALPEINSRDEMWRLRESFDFMQRSLNNFVEETKNTTAEKERIDSELRISANIQMGMIPQNFSDFFTRKDLDLYAVLCPAKEVGGDLYDFFIQNNKLHLIIGDVSGKGVPSAILMAVCSSLFHSVALHIEKPEDIVKFLNISLVEKNDSNMFITLFVAVLDLETGLMQFCNAGHNPPLIISPQGKPAFLKQKSNLPIGIFKDVEYEGESIYIEEEASLFLYTDGLTEAENEKQELYGNDRLLEIASIFAPKTAQDFIISMEKNLKAYAGNAEQSDDLSMLFLRYKFKDQVLYSKDILIKNEISEIESLRFFVEDFIKNAGYHEECLSRFNLALEEAISNIIFYGYPEKEESEIFIQIEKYTHHSIFTIKDTSQFFDLSLVPEVDTQLPIEERLIGGLGVHLIRQIMDKVEYIRDEKTNILILTYYEHKHRQKR